MPSPTCLCCNRDLSVAESIDRGIGPKCAARIGEHMFDQGGDSVDLPFDDVSKDIAVERRPDGLHFNIWPAIVYHSPTGFEISYAGSGPADFALNIMEIFCREAGDKPTMKLGSQHICPRAWKLHQDFKFKFIATMPREGGTIRGEEIRQWIRENL